MPKSVYVHEDTESMYPKLINIDIKDNKYDINQIIENRILKLKTECDTNDN